MSLKHAFQSAKSDGADATLVQPSAWNADHVVDADGMLMASGATIPAAPASGFVTLFGKTLAGRNMPATIGPSGLDTILQPFFGRNKIATWLPSGSTTTNPVTPTGILIPTYTGTSTARSVSASSFATSLRRHGVVSAATAGQGCRASTNTNQFWRGDGAGKGGFTAVFRWVPSDAATVAGARSFVGFATTGFGNVEPSSLINMVGVGSDAADTNLHIMHNDGSGVATKVSLGANFPDHTLSTDVYELALFCPPNGATISWQVSRLNTGDVATGTISTDLPASTTLMQPQFGRNNNTTALAVAFDIVSLYIETDT